MLQVTKLLSQGHGLAATLLKRSSTAELGWDVRQKNTFEATDSHGRRFAVFLPSGTIVRGGDVLVADDGSTIRIVAAPQPVLVVTHVGDRGTLFDLVRAAYHLGSRHVAVELKADHLKIEPDPALAEMLRGMHLVVNQAFAPFEPESDVHAHHAEHSHSREAAHKHPPAFEHEHDTQVHEHEHDLPKPRDGEHGRSPAG